MELKFILEALLFAAQKPLSVRELKELLSQAADQPSSSSETEPFRKTKEEAIEAVLEELARDHAAAQRSYRLVCVAGSWQFVSQPEFMPWLRALVGQKLRPPRLSQPALETLAIIAYRQPLTRAEIEQIRGVSVDGVLQTLLERGLIEQKGRAEVVGRPQTYGTTGLFLEYFGLGALEDLPAADELRRIVVEKPEALLTADAAPSAAAAEAGSAGGGQAGAEPAAAAPAEASPAGDAAAPPSEPGSETSDESAPRPAPIPDSSSEKPE